MRELLIGAIAMGYAVTGLFFLRFWKKTNDRLFAIFAAAFWTLCLVRLGLTFTAKEDAYYLYWIRLFAYLLIVIAIVDKNRRPAEESPLE